MLPTSPSPNSKTILRRVDLGTLTIPIDADVPTVLLSSGKSVQRTKIEIVRLRDILDGYLESIPERAIEKNTRSMLGTHIGHLKRLIGEAFKASDMKLETMQDYVNKRGEEPGIRGRKLSPTTIKKELVTLKAAWEWATESGLPIPSLPHKRKLRFAKTEEKPPFKTWSEIERIVSRGNLSESAAQDYWDCVYLSSDLIADLLTDVDSFDRQPFIYPMFATAAYTGARRSELLRSQVEDIDLESKQIVLREKKRIRGRRSTRSVPITDGLSRILTDWFNRHPGGPSTFTTDGTPLSVNQAHNHFIDTLEESKWYVLRGWHVLRHSFISNCASAGVDQRMIDDWVGHQTDEMRRRYRHLFPTKQREALSSVFRAKDT